MKIKFYASTDKLGSETSKTIEIDIEEWSEMTDSEKEQLGLETLIQSFKLTFGWQEC